MPAKSFSASGLRSQRGHNHEKAPDRLDRGSARRGFRGNQRHAGRCRADLRSTDSERAVRRDPGARRGIVGTTGYSRGYRNYRSGYRYDNGWWFPAGAFVAGALIGGAIANNNYYGGYYGNRYYNDGYYGPLLHAPATTRLPGSIIRREGPHTGRATVTAIVMATAHATTTTSPARRDCKTQASAELGITETTKTPPRAGFFVRGLGFASKRTTMTS